MRALGLPNTKHFHEITKIEDAIACTFASPFFQLILSDRTVAEKLKAEGKQAQYRVEEMEELEDAEGNVYNRKVSSFALLRRFTLTLRSDVRGSGEAGLAVNECRADLHAFSFVWARAHARPRPVSVRQTYSTWLAVLEQDLTSPMRHGLVIVDHAACSDHGLALPLSCSLTLAARPSDARRAFERPHVSVHLA